MITHDALPVQSGLLEVEQESDLQIGDVEVSKDLSNVALIESSGDLRVDNNGVVNDEVGTSLPMK